MVQLVNYRRNGDAFVNYLSVTPIHNDAGVLTHYVGIQSDITELVNHKKAELAAKHAAVQVSASCTTSNGYVPRPGLAARHSETQDPVRLEQAMPESWSKCATKAQ